MNNYVSTTINGTRIIVKNDVIHIKQRGRHYRFPLLNSSSNKPISISIYDNAAEINGHRYDLDNLCQYIDIGDIEVSKRRSKPKKEGFFSRLIDFVCEVFR